VRTTARRFAAQLIVALEIAVALTLVAGSSLMARTIVALRDANPGWKTDHLLAAQIFLPQSKIPSMVPETDRSCVDISIENQSPASDPSATMLQYGLNDGEC
jgi:hypothetical protein